MGIEEVVEHHEGDPRKANVRKSAVWLSQLHKAHLQREVERRIGRGEDKIDGQRINMNRSYIIRELIDIWVNSGLHVEEFRALVEEGVKRAGNADAKA